MSDGLRDAFRRAQSLQADLDKPQPADQQTQQGGRVTTWQPLPDSEVTRGLAAMIVFNGLHDYADCRLCRQVPTDTSRRDQEQTTRIATLEQALRIERGKVYDLQQENERLRDALAEAAGWEDVPDGEYRHEGDADFDGGLPTLMVAHTALNDVPYFEIKDAIGYGLMFELLDGWVLHRRRQPRQEGDAS